VAGKSDDQRVILVHAGEQQVQLLHDVVLERTVAVLGHLVVQHDDVVGVEAGFQKRILEFVDVVNRVGQRLQLCLVVLRAADQDRVPRAAGSRGNCWGRRRGRARKAEQCERRQASWVCHGFSPRSGCGRALL
jgi:hypothetical protein